MEKLAALTEQLGASMSDLWPRVALVYWRTALAECVLLAAMVGVGASYAYRVAKRWPDPDEEMGAAILGVIAAVAALVGVIGLLIEGPRLLGALVDPGAALVRDALTACRR